ncbi:integrase [Rhizobium leguminosarum]|uniref:site-specific integrase n=1 Tax=Rhizobium leguminosarum TaxID=384 RepID=UPI00161CD0D8|nr:site-specific integrase [Rhizobium leguminosarum]MBB4585581.1 integrase [Rhizobium leguminosarum]
MSKRSANTAVTELPPLPSSATTREGVIFDPREDHWPLRGIAGVDAMKFSEFKDATATFVVRLKWTMLTHLQNKSYSHVFNLFNTFKFFYRTVPRAPNSVYEQVDLAAVLTFRGALSTAQEWRLGVIRILFVDMDRLGFGIATREVIEYLESSTIRGNIKGTSVRTRDPEKGAFVDTELLAIQSSLNNAYATGEIDLYAFAIAWLFLAYGPRPIQIAAMKEQDLIVTNTVDGPLYALRVPRAKQQGEKVRSSFNTRYCSKQVGNLLERVIETNKTRRAELRLEGKNWPMFMADREGPLPEMPFHMISTTVGRVVNNVVGRIAGLKTNAKRFRITLAQRAVDDGKDKHTVAELLDHSDTQNVEVYYEASPAMVLRLDHHLAMELAPLAQAFAGVVVASEVDARRGDDRSSRIFDRSLADNINDALGTCGQMSFCGLAAPYACYTCRHFQPWIDGPHEEFMAALIADRDRQEAEGYSAKIYTIRDRTILAVAEVIQLCVAEADLRAGAAA